MLVSIIHSGFPKDFYYWAGPQSSNAIYNKLRRLESDLIRLFESLKALKKFNSITATLNIECQPVYLSSLLKLFF